MYIPMRSGGSERVGWDKHPTKLVWRSERTYLCPPYDRTFSMATGLSSGWLRRAGTG
jgi:hypothetical protein